MRRAFALGLAVLLACELGEEDGGGPGFGAEQTVTFVSTDTLDGWARTDATGTSGSARVVVGDLEPSLSGHRGFYSFDISAIPAGSAVTSATLQLYQLSISGGPYDLGNLIADHVDYGTTLDVADFAAAPLLSNIGTVSTNANVEAKSLVVTARVQNDVTAGRPRSQFRIRFSNADNNNVPTATTDRRSC